MIPKNGPNTDSIAPTELARDSICSISSRVRAALSGQRQAITIHSISPQANSHYAAKSPNRIAINGDTRKETNDDPVMIRKVRPIQLKA